MIDVERQVGSVARRLARRALEAGDAWVSTIGKVYDTGVKDLWDACTDPERIPRWFLPVSGDLRLGGRYQLEGNAGGTIERCDPPHGFAATWEYGDELTWIEVRLAPEGEGRTRLELDHVAQVDGERWAQYGPGATGVGWDLTLVGLGLHLASGAAVDRCEAEAWVAGPDGRRFIALSSDRWCEASILAGTDEPAAREAAARTTAAYTGEA